MATVGGVVKMPGKLFETSLLCSSSSLNTSLFPFSDGFRVAERRWWVLGSVLVCWIWGCFRVSGDRSRNDGGNEWVWIGGKKWFGMFG